jgi:FAD:protein FMN transferase
MILHRVIFKAMGCENEIQLYASGEAAARDAAGKAVAEVRRIERTYSRYRDDSIVGHINRMAGQSAVAVDAETAALLNYADTCHRASNGLFDITSGVLRRIWNFHNNIPPSEQAIAATLPLIGWDKLEWDGSRIRLRAGMEIDFGGIGKEYAVDRGAAALRAAGVASGLVNLGGDVHVLGPHPDGSPWRISICHPRRPGEFITAVHLARGALATSGDYQRFLDFGGKRYSHILNPRTGWPASYWQSVTVIAGQCAHAGSSATIAMLLEGEAWPFLEQRGVSFLLVDPQGRLRQKQAVSSGSPGA